MGTAAKDGVGVGVAVAIVLACAGGGTNAQIAADLGVARGTVAKWPGRFLTGGLDGLADEPRPGAPRKVSDAQVEEVITRTLEEAPPNGDTHWTSRSMAKASGLSQSTVSRMWRAFGRNLHLVKTWKLSADPQFVTKVRDVVGLYLNPAKRAIVFCVDEKSQIQAIDRTAPILPILPTTPTRMTHDYVRHGTTALDPTSSAVIANHYRRHRHQEFLRFLDTAVPAGYDLHLVLDNYATHKTEPVKKWLLRHPASTSTSPRPQRHGSTASSAGSPNSPPASSAASRTTRSPRSKPTSAHGSMRGTPTRSRSSRPRPPTRS